MTTELEDTDTDGETGETGFVGSYLLYLLAAASDKASAQFHAQVREAGLRVPEWRVLACLHDNEAMMITGLAELSLLEQSRMTRIIEQMESKGLVRRGSDARDKRRVRVSLTETGRQTADRLVALARRHEDELLSVLADTDAARVKPVLQALLKRLAER